jgi:hypothetical protein
MEKEKKFKGLKLKILKDKAVDRFKVQCIHNFTDGWRDVLMSFDGQHIYPGNYSGLYARPVPFETDTKQKAQDVVDGIIGYVSSVWGNDGDSIDTGIFIGEEEHGQ